MLLNYSFEEAVKQLQEARLVRDDVLIPASAPAAHHSPYRPGYDWLFWYERKLARFLEPWLKEFRYELIGEKGILCEALSNSFIHGHKREPKLPITVKVYLGQRGLMVQIKNSGSGFDVEKIKSDLQSGKEYFHQAGNGLRRMTNSRRFGVFYDDRGNTFHMLYYFPQSIARPGK